MKSYCDDEIDKYLVTKALQVKTLNIKIDLDSFDAFPIRLEENWFPSITLSKNKYN